LCEQAWLRVAIAAFAESGFPEFTRFFIPAFPPGAATYNLLQPLALPIELSGNKFSKALKMTIMLILPVLSRFL